MNEYQDPFVIDSDPVVDWPVSVKLPSAGGKFTERQFTASMRVLSPADYEALIKTAPAADGQKIQPMSEIIQENVPIFQRLIVGWEGVKDKSGNPVLFTTEKLAEQINGPNGPALSAGLWRAIHEVRFGTRLNDGTQKDSAQLGN